MILKIFVGSLLAAFGAAALLLVTTTGGATPAAEATVHSLTRSPKVVSTSTAGTNPSNEIKKILDSESIISIVADDGGDDGTQDLRILATVGKLSPDVNGCTAKNCNKNVVGDDTSSLTIPDAKNVLRFVQVIYLAPSAGPATASITVLQLASVATTTITVRGAASEVQVSALKTEPTKGCTGSAAKVIQSTTATDNIPAKDKNEEGKPVDIPAVIHNQADAWICATVSDSMGNKLAEEPVVFTATLGTVGPTDETTTARGAISTLKHGTTGKSGTTSTVQAWSSAKTATVDVQFGGNAAACVITTDPDVLEVGQVGKVSVSVTDSEGGPVPDGSAVNLDTVSSVPKTTFLILTTDPKTSDGAASSEILASVEGTIAVIAKAGSKTCTSSVQVGGAAAPPPAPGTGMDVGFTGELPASGFATVTFTGSIEDLKAALATSCAGGAPIFGSLVVDGVGSLIPYFPTTALSAPNAAFEAAFAGGLSGTPLIAGNCGS